MNREVLQELHDLLPKEGSAEFLAGASHMLSLLDDLLKFDIEKTLKKEMHSILTMVAARSDIENIHLDRTLCGYAQNRIMSALIQEGSHAHDVQGVHVEFVLDPRSFDTDTTMQRIIMHTQVYYEDAPTRRVSYSHTKVLSHEFNRF